jgi:hypothetical protein
VVLFVRTARNKQNFTKKVMSHPQTEKKGKVHPRTGHEGPKWSRSIGLLFLQPRC